jgi:hypothetical protein
MAIFAALSNQDSCNFFAKNSGYQMIAVVGWLKKLDQELIEINYSRIWK